MHSLFTDLDHTLIDSNPSILGPNPLVVEHKEGAPLSYMSAFTAQELATLCQSVRLIPVTTRSRAQYRRIVFPGGFVPEYALAANGAILLKDGAEDPLWFAETLQIIAASAAQMDKGGALLARDPDVNFPLRKVDDVFWYTKSARPRESCARLRAELDVQLVTPLYHGSKLYLLPRGLHKGAALCRLRDRLGLRHTICAGDSALDLSLLQEGDLAFAPQELAAGAALPPHVILLRGEAPFSDLLLRALLRYWKP